MRSDYRPNDSTVCESLLMGNIIRSIKWWVTLREQIGSKWSLSFLVCERRASKGTIRRFKTNEENVFTVCIWTVEFAAEGCHACQKVCTGSKSWKKTHLSLLNTMIRLLADEVNSPSHRSLEAGGVLVHITACLLCPYVLFHKHLLLYQYWRE